jgi:hypothetical protein
MVGADVRRVAEIDVGFLPLRQGFDLRVFSLQPYVDGPLLASCWAVL